MALIYHELNIPLDTDSTFDYIVIKQGDAGSHKVRATLINNNSVFTIPTSNATYYFKFRKPDNTYVLVQATVSNNQIIADVTEEMLRVAGTGRGEFMIVQGSTELKTATFYFKIVQQTYTTDDVISSSDFATFASLLAGAGNAASNANAAAAAANTAAANAAAKADLIPDDYTALVQQVEDIQEELENLDVETDATLTEQGKPADAKATGDAIAELNGSLGALVVKKATKIEQWTQGGIVSNTGGNTSSSVVIRMNNAPLVHYAVVDGYYLRVYGWDEQAVYLGVWNGTEFTKPYATNDSHKIYDVDLAQVPAQNIKLTLARNDGGNIVVAEGVNAKVVSATDETLTISGKAADAKTVGDILAADAKKIDNILFSTVPVSGIDFVWEQGAIASSGGTASQSATRIRSPYINNGHKAYKVTVDSQYKIALFAYNSANTSSGSYAGCWNGEKLIDGTITWLTELTLSFINYPYIRLVMRKADNTNITVQDSGNCYFFEDKINTVSNEVSVLSKVVGVRGNLIKAIINNATIDNTDGNLIYDASYQTTEYIPLPKWNSNPRYNPFTRLYVMSYNGNAYVGAYEKVVFYDKERTMISIAPSEDLTIPDEAEYVRAVFPKANTNCYVGCGTLDEMPSYQPYHATVSDDFVPSIANTIHNSDGAKTNLVKAALQYYGNTDFGYGNTHTAYSESAEAVESDGITSANGSQSNQKCYDGIKFQIDCSGFTRLTMQCIYPEYTRHYGVDNIAPPWGYQYDENADFDTPQGRLTAHKQALYAYQRGFLYALQGDYSNAEVGDMIFVANSSLMWGKIGHARIITNVTPLKNGGKEVTVMEADGSFPPVHARKSTERAYNQYYAARFPLPYADGADIIGSAQAANVQTTEQDEIFATINLNEPTNNKEIYTIVFKANLETDGNYVIVTGLGNDISFENILVYNGLHVMSVVLPVDGSAGSNTVSIKAHNADFVTFGGAKVYKGFHTPAMSEFN